MSQMSDLMFDVSSSRSISQIWWSGCLVWWSGLISRVVGGGYLCLGPCIRQYLCSKVPYLCLRVNISQLKDSSACPVSCLSDVRSQISDWWLGCLWCLISRVVGGGYLCLGLCIRQYLCSKVPYLCLRVISHVSDVRSHVRCV